MGRRYRLLLLAGGGMALGGACPGCGTSPGSSTPTGGTGVSTMEDTGASSGGLEHTGGSSVASGETGDSLSPLGETGDSSVVVGETGDTGPVLGNPVAFTEVALGEALDVEHCSTTIQECEENLLLAVVSSHAELTALFEARLPPEDPPSVDFASFQAVVGYIELVPHGENVLHIDAVYAEGTELHVQATSQYPLYPPEIVTRPYVVITVPADGYTTATGEVTLQFDTEP